MLISYICYEKIRRQPLKLRLRVLQALLIRCLTRRETQFSELRVATRQRAEGSSRIVVYIFICYITWILPQVYARRREIIHILRKWKPWKWPDILWVRSSIVLSSKTLVWGGLAPHRGLGSLLDRVGSRSHDCSRLHNLSHLLHLEGALILRSYVRLGAQSLLKFSSWCNLRMDLVGIGWTLLIFSWFNGSSFYFHS